MRQDSVLWGQLHQGVLTTGQLNAALGFYEPEAARTLGIPGNRVRHGALLGVYNNLRQPPYIPEPQVALGRPDPAPRGAAPASMPAGGAAHMLLPGAEAQLPELVRPEGMGRTAWRNKLRRFRKHTQQGQPSPALPQATALLRQQQQAQKMELERQRIVREAQQARSRAAAAQGKQRPLLSLTATRCSRCIQDEQTLMQFNNGLCTRPDEIKAAQACCGCLLHFQTSVFTCVLLAPCARSSLLSV